jgi:hypothetical protein
MLSVPCEQPGTRVPGFAPYDFQDQVFREHLTASRDNRFWRHFVCLRTHASPPEIEIAKKKGRRAPRLGGLLSVL